MSPWREAGEGDFAVVGDPVAHSLSPRMHNEAFKHLGLPFLYQAVHVPQGELSQAISYLRAKRYRGLNVTLPLKFEAFDLHWSTDQSSERYRAINCLNFEEQRATNTDVPAFLATLECLNLPDQACALLLGAGGSAKSLGIALIEAGYSLRVWNRTLARARELAEEVGATVLESADPEGCDLILNATSANLIGESPPVLWDRSADSCRAYDLAYSKKPTPFIRSARQRGLLAIDGRAMLVEQGALSLEWWLGVTAPREAMRQAVDKELDVS